MIRWQEHCENGVRDGQTDGWTEPFLRAASSQLKTGFEITNETEGQGQSSPKSIGILTVLRCIFGPNLEIPTSTSSELLHRQAQNGVNFYFYVQFDLVKVNQPQKQ